jgi:serine/threonine protein kinase
MERWKNELLKGIQFFHENKIIHRNIKPALVFILFFFSLFI